MASSHVVDALDVERSIRCTSPRSLMRKVRCEGGEEARRREDSDCCRPRSGVSSVFASVGSVFGRTDTDLGDGSANVIAVGRSTGQNAGAASVAEFWRAPPLVSVGPALGVSLLFALPPATGGGEGHCTIGCANVQSAP